jgi:hypothetical protein
MKRLWMILVLLFLAAVAWAGWSYLGTEGTVRDIASRLPSEESLNRLPLEETAEQLKLATIQCRRVASLEANPISRLLRDNEIKALTERCELIESRRQALQGP